jgi:hypothetical protein
MCGNVTVMGRLTATDKRAVPKASWLLLERMLRVSQMRGAQSGGGAIQIRCGNEAGQLIEKCLNQVRLGSRERNHAYALLTRTALHQLDSEVNEVKRAVDGKDDSPGRSGDGERPRYDSDTT